MDQIYGFSNLAEGEVLTINPRTGTRGILELHPLKGSVVIFKGAVSADEAAAAMKIKGRNSFALSANEFSPAALVYDGNQSEFTLFAVSAASGHVRISEY